MRCRVKKGGKWYSRGKGKVVGSDLDERAVDGARVVPEGVIEGG